MSKSIFLKRLSATAQFFLGFILGIGLIAGITGTLVFAYYTKMSVLPKKPVFSPAPVSETTPDLVEAAIEPLESTSIEEVPETTTPVAVESEPEPEPEPEPALPANAYRATVTWHEGLSLRAEPSIEATRVGGIATKATIIILEDSADGKWQRVRLPWNGQEGWVKGGNTRRI
ncbi:MAG: SH3 domain-containing protein [Cyanobacteria bacterium P01_C01_bin.72]